MDFEALFRRTPNAYLLLDRELRILDANDTYLALMASRREDIVGRDVFHAFPNDENDPNNAPVELLRRSFARVLASGEPDHVALIPYSVPTHTPDGVVLKERFWSATHVPLFDVPGGPVRRILQHTVDVTDLQELRNRARPGHLAAPEADVLRRAEGVQRANVVLDVERRHLRRLFEQAPVFVCFLRGPQHVFELVNPAYSQLVGHRDVVGHPVAEALPEIGGQGFVRLLDQVFASGVPFVGRGIRAMLEPSPGAPLEERVLDFTYQPIVDSDGTVSGIFVVGTDITERTRATAERERLATIVEQSADFIASADLAGAVTFVNEAGRAMFGVADAAQLHGTDFFHPDDLPFVLGTIAPAVEATGRWRGEIRLRHLVTGESIPVDYHVFAVRDPATGLPLGAASVTRDLRERRQLEERRDTAESEYRFLTHTIPTQVWTANPQGGLTYVNDRVTEYFGRSAQDMLDSGWQDGLHPDDLDLCIQRWTESLVTGVPYETEFRLRRASDQTYRWHVARAVAMRDASGAIVKWYGTNSDIDVQKRTTSERDALIQALEASNADLDRFAFVASHDLKSPLRGIANIAQWLEEDLDDRLDDKSRENLGLLRSRVTRMHALVDGVLNYARATKANDATEIVDVRVVLSDVVDLLAQTDSSRVVIGDGMPALTTSQTALQQVFLNLVGNALKHANRDDAQVAVTVGDAGAWWRFAITDNGPGIAPQHHERIWNLFQTLRADGVESTGLGLSLVKRVVEARGGSVGVDSELGRGSTFFFTWPKREPGAP